MQQSRHLGRDHGDRHHEQCRVALYQPEIATQAVAEQGAGGKRGHEPQQRGTGGRRVQCARAGHRLAGGQQQREQDRRGQVLEHRGGEEHPREGAAGVELAEHAHRHGRGGHGRQRAERDGHGDGVAGWLVHREREPRAHRQEHGRDEEERKRDPARNDACQRDALASL